MRPAQRGRWRNPAYARVLLAGPVAKCADPPVRREGLRCGSIPLCPCGIYAGAVVLAAGPACNYGSGWVPAPFCRRRARWVNEPEYMVASKPSL